MPNKKRRVIRLQQQWELTRIGDVPVWVDNDGNVECVNPTDTLPHRNLADWVTCNCHAVITLADAHVVPVN